METELPSVRRSCHRSKELAFRRDLADSYTSLGRFYESRTDTGPRMVPVRSRISRGAQAS
jgi:hypothetical protein